MGDPIFEDVYQSILRRDTRHDGRYYVGIVTTGIFCRPSCRSRTPKPENVRIYTSIEAAREAGFRPCKRCRPETPGENGPDAQLVQEVTELIAGRYSEPLTLPQIADHLNISPYHLQRVYKRMTGTTPAKRLLDTRMEAAKRRLAEAHDPITEIAGAVGFRSVSHFTVAFRRMHGCTPQEYRSRFL